MLSSSNWILSFYLSLKSYLLETLNLAPYAQFLALIFFIFFLLSSPLHDTVWVLDINLFHMSIVGQLSLINPALSFCVCSHKENGHGSKEDVAFHLAVLLYGQKFPYLWRADRYVQCWLPRETLRVLSEEPNSLLAKPVWLLQEKMQPSVCVVFQKCTFLHSQNLSFQKNIGHLTNTSLSVCWG